jgi:hypothetical protein
MNILANFATAEERYWDEVTEAHDAGDCSKTIDCPICREEAERDRPGGPMTKMRRKRDER